MKRIRLKRLVALMLASSLPLQAISAELPSVTILGEGGVYFSGWLDGLFPYYHHTDRLAYTDIQFEGSNSQSGIFSVGSGYRQFINRSGILGSYIFYDRVRSGAEEYYNVISPGVEYLTPSWQYRLNYYAPFGKKRHETSTGWADAYGNYTYIQFSGHEEYDQRATQYESLSYGGDGTLSYRFQRDARWQLSFSPYVFDRKEESTLFGANVQLDFYQSKNTQVFVGDGYDNESHNRVYVGVAFNFGGRDNSNRLENLLVSPVYRNLSVNTTESGVGVGEETTYSGVEALEQDDIYFEDSNAESGGDGTYEDPYSVIDEFNADNAAGEVESDASLWLSASSTPYASSTSIALTDDQSIEGRSEDYTQAASAGEVVIESAEGMNLAGNNTVSDVTLEGDGTPESVGITVTGNATLDNIIVGTNTLAGSYQIALELEDGANATITDSTIQAYGETYFVDPVTGDNVGAYGIYAKGNNQLIIEGSTVAAEVTDGASLSAGITALSGTITTITDSTITATNNTWQAFGLYLYQAGNTTVSNSTINAAAVGEGTYSSATGVNMWYADGDITISDSSINATAESTNWSTAVGVGEYTTTGDLTVTNSTITTDAVSPYIVVSRGVDTQTTTGDILITGSVINASTDFLGDSSRNVINTTGVYLQSGHSTLTIEDSTINVESDATYGESIGVVNKSSSVATVSDSTVNLSGNTKTASTGNQTTTFTNTDINYTDD